MKTPPLRAAARIAWRTARRSPRRSALVVIMVALPIALMTGTATIARTIIGTPEEDVATTLGAADIVFTVEAGFDPERLLDRLPEGSEVVAVRWTDLSTIRSGELMHVSLVEPATGLEDPLLRGMYELRSGTAPSAPGEAAVNGRLLEGFAAHVGGTVDLGPRSLRITGTVEGRDLDDPLAIVGAGTLTGKRGAANLFVDLPAGTSVSTLTPLTHELWHHGFTTRDEVAEFAARDAMAWDGVSTVGGVLALFATGLIVAAAFVVGARRQLRELGLIGAVGAHPRHVRSVVWLGGTTLGLAGGALGSGVGIGLSAVVHPFLGRLVGRLVGPLDVNPLVVLTAIVMGVVAATLSALGPARAASKLSPVAALAGRTPPPRPPGRVALLGVLVLCGAGAVTAWGTIGSADGVLAVGLIGMLVGVLLGVPLLVSTIGRIAGRMPTAVRLAARDAGRHGRRTGAAVAAAVIALSVPIAVSAYSLSEEAYERRSPRLDANHLLIGVWSEVATEASAEDVAAEFKKTFPDATVVSLTQPILRGRPGGPVPVSAFGAVEEVTPGSFAVTGWPLFVGDAAMLRAIHAEGALDVLRRGRAAVLGGYRTNRGFVRVGVARERNVKIPATAVDSPSYLNEAIPKIVVSPATAARLGLDTAALQHLLVAPQPLGSDDVARARDIAARHPGYFVKSNDDYLPRYALGRAAATAATIPLALAVLAVAIALVASESRRSHQILVAVGAGPVAHRKVVAATSGILAAIAAVLAVPAGLLPTVVVQIASRTGRPLVVPWTTIAIVVIVTPAVSALVAGLVARTPKLGSLLRPAT